MTGVDMAGMAVAVCAVAAAFSGRVKRHQAYGMLGLASLVFMVGSVIDHRTTGALLDSAVTAWYGYRWWTGGGGDDTKKRLRKIARRFEGARRTAPVASG